MRLTSSMLESHVASRVRRLQEGARRIGQGDLEYRIVFHRQDEIGQLWTAFHEMAARLREREAELSARSTTLENEANERRRADAELRRAHDELEQRVRDRPSELVEANALLQQEISARKSTEQALRESEERYALALRGTNDGLWDWNLPSGEIVFSERWKAILGYPEDEIDQDSAEWFKRVHPEDLPQLKATLDSHLGGSSEHFECEYRMLHRDGAYRWMQARGLAVRDADNQAYRMVGSQTDITGRKAAEEQLRHHALHDALTDLPNRVLFLDRLGHAIERTQRSRSSVAVLFMNLDRFKVINDSLGHPVGDQLLVAIARRLEDCLRSSDTVARLSGDEFAILLEDIADVRDAARLADRIKLYSASPFFLSGHEVFTSASLGIALSKSGHDRPADLPRDAETAMYRAKSLGKARHEIFDAEMHAHAVAMLDLEADLRRAIERQEFCLHYQPILSLATGRITTFEALVRWQRPTRGLLFPNEFITFAEETGLIVFIDEWVLQTAVLQNRHWSRAGFKDIGMGVNFTARQFQNPNLPANIQQVLTGAGVPPESLTIEATESTAIQNVTTSTRMMADLSKMELRIAIDDFGTAYSSLGYLKRFPPRTLKIDKSFVRGVAAGPGDAKQEGDAAIVKAIIAMAHSLNLTVVAEGVETQPELEFLRSQGCDAAQGYLISRPVPPDQAMGLLERYNGGGMVVAEESETAIRQLGD